MIPELAIVTATAGCAIHGAFYRNSFVFGKVMGHLPPNNESTKKFVSLTFDDGPNPEATPLILDTLAKEGVKATFFLLGKHVERWPEIAYRVALEGHQIGNHGYFHQKLHLKTPSYVSDDIARGKKVIENACNISPRLFRAPHGFRSPWVNHIAQKQSQRVIGWSLGVWDSDMPGVNEIADRTIDGVRPGHIVLLHDGDGYNPMGNRLQTAAALPLIITALKDKGYTFTTL